MLKITLYLSLVCIFAISCQSKKNNTQAGQNASFLLPVQEFAQKCPTQSAQLVDVRSPEEFAAGTLEGAVNVDYNNPNFESELQKLDKSKPLCIFCQVGGRSAKAHKIALNAGFKQVIEMEGGYKAWQKEQNK